MEEGIEIGPKESRGRISFRIDLHIFWGSSTDDVLKLSSLCMFGYDNNLSFLSLATVNTVSMIFRDR